MTLQQKVVAILIAVGIFFVIFELVRRRRLREEYSWLWLLTGCLLIVLTLWYEMLLWITHLIGAIAPQSALFFLAIIFLMLVCIQFSVRISKLTDHVKNLNQEISILKAEITNKKI